DNIILHSLRSIGCEIEDDVQSLKQFSTEVIVACAVRCLKTILQDVDLPNYLPQAMSAKFRMGTTLASHLQDLGYRGDLGYQTFLYSNEADIRKIFMFLVDKLPKEAVEATEETVWCVTPKKYIRDVGSTAVFPMGASILKAARRHLAGKTSHVAARGHMLHASLSCSLYRCPRRISRPDQENTKSLPFITCQPLHHGDTVPSVLEANTMDVTAQHEWEAEWNSAGLASRLTQQITDQLRQDRQRSGAGAESGLSNDLQQVIASISGRGSSQAKTKGSRFTHTEKLLFAKDDDKAMSEVQVQAPAGKTEEEKQQEREDEVGRLREELNSLSAGLEKLELEVRKFAASKQQMDEEIANQARSNTDKEEGYKVKKRTLDLLPDAENNIAKLQTVVDSSAQRLGSEFERMTKDVNRSAYTKRIMEIVANIKKQKMEIDKVLVDTRSVQKEINQLSGKLDRQFTVTDELIFRDAKKDESVKKSYRCLAALHENCELLIKTVEETGVIMREIRELEDQVLANLEKITADYQQMKKENDTLLKKKKAKS
ncbi:CCD22-like protein, partial [Mya arenaria]